MLNATITYTLTEGAQRAQMVATGQPVARKQLHEFEIDTADIGLFEVAANGGLSLNADTVTINYTHFPSGVGATPVTSAAEALAAYKAARATRMAEIEKQEREEEERNARTRAVTEAADAQAAAWLDALQARPGMWMRQTDALHAAGVQFPNLNAQLPLTVAALGHLQERIAAVAAENEMADRARDKAKNEFMDNWVAAQNDPGLLQQHADGLLCRSSITTMISRSVLDPIAPQYTPHTCDSREHKCGRADIDCLPRAIYPAWVALRAKLPVGTTAGFETVRECLLDGEFSDVVEGDDEEEGLGPVRHAVYLKVPHGPFVFERLVELAAPQHQTLESQAGARG